MSKYRFAFSADVSVRYEAAADGQQRLDAWVKESSYADAAGEVWLVDLPHDPFVAVRLLLPPVVTADAKHWTGDIFAADGSVLDIIVEATEPASAYGLLAEKLFRFGGDSASFPVYLTRKVSGSWRAAAKSGWELLIAAEGPELRHGRVKVQPVDLARCRAAAGEDVAIEYLTVLLPRETGVKASNWKVVG